MTKYLFLFGAIFCEVVGTLLLPVSQNFTKLVPTVTLALFYLCAFYFLTFAIKSIPLPIVYATWSGLGVFSIAIFSYIFYKQALNWQIIAGLFLIIIGVVLTFKILDFNISKKKKLIQLSNISIVILITIFLFELSFFCSILSVQQSCIVSLFSAL